MTLAKARWILFFCSIIMPILLPLWLLSLFARDEEEVSYSYPLVDQKVRVLQDDNAKENIVCVDLTVGNKTYPRKVIKYSYESQKSKENKKRNGISEDFDIGETI